jgi:hypothetical protein
MKTKDDCGCGKPLKVNDPRKRVIRKPKPKKSMLK